MTPTIAKSEPWEPCPPGELVCAAQRMRARPRDRIAARLIGVAGAFVIVAFAGWLAVSRFTRTQQHRFGGITCDQTKQHLQEYTEGRLTDATLVDRIAVHLRECPECGPLARKMFPQLSQFRRTGPPSQRCCGHNGPRRDRHEPPVTHLYLVAWLGR